MSSAQYSSSTPIVIVASCSLTLIAVGAYSYLSRTVSSNTERSTTSSAGGGAPAYETQKAVDEYLQMHYATPDELFLYKKAPKDDARFTERCSILVERHCTALQNFSDERDPTTALDIGCAVGGASFQLANVGFDHVMGIDFSAAFINAANRLKAEKEIEYQCTDEGNLQVQRTARIDEDLNTSGVRFRTGDACNLGRLPAVDALLAANLICRLPDPMKFLNALPNLIKPGGVVVLTTPWSWLEAWTPQDKWLGGYKENGKPVKSFDTLTRVMTENGFKLKTTEDMPFVIREHSRKYQWGCTQGSVWLKV